MIESFKIQNINDVVDNKILCKVTDRAVPIKSFVTLEGQAIQNRN